MHHTKHLVGNRFNELFVPKEHLGTRKSHLLLVCCLSPTVGHVPALSGVGSSGSFLKGIAMMRFLPPNLFLKCFRSFANFYIAVVPRAFEVMVIIQVSSCFF